MKEHLYLKLILILLLTGCSNVDIGSIGRIAQETFKAATPLSDEEEYYVGRAVAARIFSSYPLLENNKLTEYVNLVGQTVAIYSDNPITYGGDHFSALNSNRINALPCTRGSTLL